MKIYGIGTDIISVSRINESLKNKNLLNRLFSKEEISRCGKLIQSKNCYAKRFAAKEAFAKALGTGITNGINFNEIIVMNEKSGKPFIKITGKTKQIIKKKLNNKAKFFLSLSDEKNYAIAFVTISI
jgi:holo-[acyl-carrier protein] synthase